MSTQVLELRERTALLASWPTLLFLRTKCPAAQYLNYGVSEILLRKSDGAFILLAGEIYCDDVVVFAV